MSSRGRAPRAPSSVRLVLAAAAGALLVLLGGGSAAALLLVVVALRVEHRLHPPLGSRLRLAPVVGEVHRHALSGDDVVLLPDLGVPDEQDLLVVVVVLDALRGAGAAVLRHDLHVPRRDDPE